MIVLGLDPGFATFGYAIATVDNGAVTRWHRAGCITTKPGPSSPLSKTEDNARRFRWVWRNLYRLRRLWPPQVICIESVAFPHGRTQLSVVSNLGRARGLVDALGMDAGAPVVEVSPATLKKAVTGLALTRKGSGISKADVEAAMVRQHPEVAEHYPSGPTREHVVDASAAIVAGVTLFPAAFRQFWEEARVEPE